MLFKRSFILGHKGWKEWVTVNCPSARDGDSVVDG